MEALNILLEKLEKKVASLVEKIQELKSENTKLVEENFQLLAKIELLETSLLTDSEHMERLKQERTLTKTAVDDLIRSIDLLVEDEKQQC